MINPIIDGDWLKESGLNLLVWSVKGKKKTSSYFQDLTIAYDHAVEESESGSDVYFGLGLSDITPGPKKRFKADEIKAIPCLWADIDYGGRENGKKYPETSEDTLALIKTILIQPSIIVDSGGGYHCYWIFKEPWVFETDKERKEAKLLMRGWQETIKSIWRAAGYTIDGTMDLTRVLRIPGTKNHKYGNDVSIYSSTDYRYNPSDFEQYISSTDGNPAVIVEEPKINLDMPLTGEETQEYIIKFTALMTEDPEFLKTFQHRRKNLKDDSLSAYDAALARRAVDAGWSDNEIVHLILMFRTQHGGLEKAKRADYMKRTIKFAREKAGRTESSNDIDHEINDLNLKIDTINSQVCRGDVEDTDEASEILADLKRKLLDTASSKFAVDILEVKKYPFDPDPEFEMITDRGEIYFGKIENLLDFRFFQRKIAASLGIVVPPIQKDHWRKYVQAILHATTLVTNMPENATDIGDARSWINQYFGHHKKPCNSLTEVYVRGSFFKRKDNKYFIPKKKFVEWLRLMGVKDSDRTIYRKLRRAGIQSTRTSASLDKGLSRISFEGFLVNEYQRVQGFRDSRIRKDDVFDEADREGSEDIWSDGGAGDELHESGGPGAGVEGDEPIF